MDCRPREGRGNAAEEEIEGQRQRSIIEEVNCMQESLDFFFSPFPFALVSFSILRREETNFIQSNHVYNFSDFGMLVVMRGSRNRR